MLTQSLPTLIPAPAEDRIQVGPVYHCFACGAQAAGLVPWPINPFNPCPLDEWAANIWYMVRPCGCRALGRVARLGDCITPLDLPNDRSKPYPQMVEENVRAVRAAVEFISQHVPHGQRSMDAPTQIVLQLLAGLMSPARAIEEIRMLTLREAAKRESVTPPQSGQGKRQ
jgi:hypothetical protein